MADRQLSLPNMPYREYADIYKKLGIIEEQFKHTTDIKKGAPAISENTVIGFFPQLGVGIETPKGTLKINRRNKKNPDDIDFDITLDSKPIAFIDNEQRGDDYLWQHPVAPPNIPTSSFKANIEQWHNRPHSQKVKYYLNFPKQSFHLSRNTSMNKAVCCRAEDFIHTKLIWHHTYFGYMWVWQCPREKTCEGKINEHTIEDWVLSKLIEGGIL
jgi:hypothetical protein